MIGGFHLGENGIRGVLSLEGCDRGVSTLERCDKGGFVTEET